VKKNVDFNLSLRVNSVVAQFIERILTYFLILPKVKLVKSDTKFKFIIIFLIILSPCLSYSITTTEIISNIQKKQTEVNDYN